MSHAEIVDNTKTSNITDGIDNLLIKHHRLCHIAKRPDFDGYGFNLHSEKGKSGQYIGKVDDHSPAENAGLKEGDRIIQVNGADIGSETHKQVVQRIKAISSEVRLLVIDPIKEKEILKQEKTVSSSTTTESIITSSATATSISSDKMANDDNILEVSGTTVKNIDTKTTESTVQSTKTTATKDNKSISSSSSSITSSPISEVKNYNDSNKEFEKNNQYDNNYNNNGKISPSGVKNYQTNIEFIINENTTIEQITNNNHSNKINDDIKEKSLIKNAAIHIDSTIPEIDNHPNKKLNNNDSSIANTTTITTITTTDSGNNSISIKSSINDDKKPSFNLPMTAAEMRAKLLAKKKYDPKNDSVDLRKKFEIIQKL